MSSKLLYRKICSDLERSIDSGELAEGALLPTVEELRARYGVSHITVLRAFHELNATGKLTKPGKRYAVAAMANSGFRPVTGVICSLMRRLTPSNPDDNYTNDINCGIQQESSHHNYSLLSLPQVSQLVYRTGSRTLPARTLTDLRYGAVAVGELVDGFIFDARIPDEEINYILERTGKPGVLIDRAQEQKSPRVDAVTPSNREAVRIICETAHRYGYRKFLFLRNTSDDYNARERLAAFHSFAATLPESDWRVAADWTCWQTPRMLPGFYRAFDELRGKDPVAVISSSDTFAYSAAQLLKEHGTELRRDFGLCGIGGFSLVFNRTPSLTTVQVNALELGRIAVQQLLRRIRGDGETNRIITTEPLLHCGETL